MMELVLAIVIALMLYIPIDMLGCMAKRKISTVSNLETLKCLEATTFICCLSKVLLLLGISYIMLMSLA